MVGVLDSEELEATGIKKAAERADEICVGPLLAGERLSIGSEAEGDAAVRPRTPSEESKLVELLLTAVPKVDAIEVEAL